jgi:predicted RNase H-like nuclease (RuvC/YqgF family)
MYCKKTSFANEKEALFYIEKLKKTSLRKKIPTRSYLCHICHNWHITSSEEWKEEKKLNTIIKSQEKTIRELKREMNDLKRQIIALNKELDEYDFNINKYK